MLVLDLFSGTQSVKKVCDKLGYEYISLDIDKSSLRVFEDNQEIYNSNSSFLNFDSAYIYFIMSSGTNYSMRIIYIDNIEIIEYSE